MISKDALKKILTHAAETSAACQNNCYDFRLMQSPLEPAVWYIRYVRSDLSDTKKPREDYRYLCYNQKGEYLNCDPKFPSRHEEATWLNSLKSYKKIPYQYQLKELCCTKKS